MKRAWLNIVSLIVLGVAAISICSCEPDTDFGTAGTGIVTSTEHSYYHDVAYRNSTSKLITVSARRDLNYFYWTVAQWNLNGTLDGSFGSSGKKTFSSITFHSPHAVALQADGKIVVAGSDFKPNTSIARVKLMRLNTNGSLDTTFGGTGIVYLYAPLSSYSLIGGAVAVQTDGKIVIGASHGVLPALDFTTNDLYYPFHSYYETFNSHVLRLLSDGTLDTSFGSAGRVTFTGGGLFDLKIRADQNITALSRKKVAQFTTSGGTTFTLNLPSTLLATALDVNENYTVITGATTDQLMAVRLVNGSYDTAFGGGDGIVTQMLDGTSVWGQDVIIRPSDKQIIMAGCVGSAESKLFGVALNWSGTIVESPVYNNVNSTLNDCILRTVIQSDNKVVGVGFTKFMNDGSNNYNDGNPLLLRYLSW